MFYGLSKEKKKKVWLKCRPTNACSKLVLKACINLGPDRSMVAKSEGS